VGGANDDTTRNPNQFDRSVCVADLFFSYSDGSQVGRAEKKKASETAKGDKAEEKARKAIRRIDAKTGV
jgi:hypothetical protein